MSYNPNIHHRRSIRLKGYDYAQVGLYFVTICVQNREHLFGKITNGEMVLNDAGKMVEKWCAELPHKFSDIMLGTYVVMPNHFHAIVGNVGADLRVCPNNNTVCPNVGTNNHFGRNDGEHLGECGNNNCGENYDNHRDEHGNEHKGEHIGSPLHAVVQWFKTMTTNEYIRGVKTLEWQPFNKKLWQRNYYEHIIRNPQSHQRIAEYIVNNPANWANDTFRTNLGNSDYDNDCRQNEDNQISQYKTNS